MRLTDFRPSSSPTLSEQRDALQKGLGRSMQWAKAGLLNAGPLLEMCLIDRRYDRQCENPRGDWLWKLIAETGTQDQFRVPILHALYDETDDWNISQLCHFAQHYAESGDETFRNLLYEFVEQKPFPENITLAEEEILQLDGEQGFLFAARVRGQRLATNEWDWDDRYFVSKAINQLGEDLIVRLLKTSSDTDIKRFYQFWNDCKQDQSQCDDNGSYIDHMQAIPVEKVIEAAHTNDASFSFTGWGRWADLTSLNSVLDTLWKTTELTVLKKLIKVFWMQTLPAFDSRLITLCQHPDEELRRRSFIALANNSHPAIRAFALEQLSIEASHNVVSLFVNNYEAGDEKRILEAISLPQDSWELHSLLSDTMKILENNPEADTSRLAVIAYAANPCEICRYKAIQLLQNRSVAPDWMIEECRYDSYEETRELSHWKTAE